jgi:hypothetical protein
VHGGAAVTSIHVGWPWSRVSPSSSPWISLRISKSSWRSSSTDEKLMEEFFHEVPSKRLSVVQIFEELDHAPVTRKASHSHGHRAHCTIQQREIVPKYLGSDHRHLHRFFLSQI